MSELDPQPLKLVEMLAASAWWTGLDSGQRTRVSAEVEERRFPGGTVVMRRGESSKRGPASSRGLSR